MRSALWTVPGVECAHVDKNKAMAMVECTPECDREALIAVLLEKGYGAEIR